MFLIALEKTFAFSMSWPNFYQIAYINKLTVFPSISPSFPRSTRAESNSESGIFTNILHSKLKYVRVKSKYVNVMCTTCITVD